MNKYKKIRNIVSLLLSFFIAISLFALYAGAVIRNNYFPGNIWRSYMLGSGYGSRMAAEAQEKLEKLLTDRGIPVEAAGNLLSHELLYAEYGYCTDDIWNQRIQEPERRTGFEEQLKTQLMEYLNGQGTAVTRQLEQEVLRLVKEAGGIYDRYLNPAWLLDMFNYKAQVGGRLTILMAAAGAAALLCATLLWLLHHHKHRSLRYICFGAESALLCSGVFLFCLSRTDWLRHAGITSEAYCGLINGLEKNAMQNGLMMLGAEALLILMLALGIKYLKHRA